MDNCLNKTLTKKLFLDFNRSGFPLAEISLNDKYNITTQ